MKRVFAYSRIFSNDTRTPQQHSNHIIKFLSKERYYGIVEKLETLHADPSKAAAKTFAYDAEHERRRKEQLCRLYDRTPEQVEEEEILRAELKKVC